MKTTMQALVKATLTRTPDSIPPGFHTSEEWADTLGINISAMRRVLQRLLIAEKVEQRMLFIPGHTRRVPFYREK